MSNDYFDSPVPVPSGPPVMLEHPNRASESDEQPQPLYNWLNDALRAERRAMALQLQRHHHTLLQECVHWHGGIPSDGSASMGGVESDSPQMSSSLVLSGRQPMKGCENSNHAKNNQKGDVFDASEVRGRASEQHERPTSIVQGPIGALLERRTSSANVPITELLLDAKHHRASDNVPRRRTSEAWKHQDQLGHTGPTVPGILECSAESGESSNAVAKSSSASTTMASAAQQPTSEFLDSNDAEEDQQEGLKQTDKQLRASRSKDNFRRRSIFDGAVNRSTLHVDGPQARCVNRMAKSAAFEVIFGLVIAINGAAMAVECQHHGFEIGHRIYFPGYEESAADYWPHAETVFEVLDIFFGVLFTLEVMIKLVGLRRAFTEDWWNVFDSVIVIGWFIDTLSRNVVHLPIDPMVLRSARLARLLRLMRLLGTLCRMDALFLMVTSLQHSLAMLFWASIMLFILLTLCAFLVNQIVVSYYLEITKDNLDNQREVFAYFGTFSRSLLTMFELTLGNWGPIARVLQENISEWFMLFSIFHKLTIGFAVISIINGIFIQETFKVAALDDNILVWQKKMAKQIHAAKMRAFVSMADASGDGTLELEEFQNILAIDQVQTWLAAQGVEGCNADVLFTLLDEDRKGYLNIDEIVEGVGKLKGAARSIDLAQLNYRQKQLDEKVDKINQGLRSLTTELRSGGLDLVGDSGAQSDSVLAISSDAREPSTHMTPIETLPSIS